MNVEELHKKLIAAARSNPPGDHVPLAFEKRVLAHLASKPAVDVSALWARALWRAVVPCVAVMVLITGLTFIPSNTTSSPGEEDLSQSFESALLASADQLEEN